jgi:hypothetical protein
LDVCRIFCSQGDSGSFHSVYHELQSLLSVSPVDEGRLDSFAASTPMPSLNGLLPDDEAARALQPIISMGSQSNFEAQLEAARIFCDLSLYDGVRQQMCDGGCIPVLASLISSANMDAVRLHAITALANISNVHTCQVRPARIFARCSVMVFFRVKGAYGLASALMKCNICCSNKPCRRRLLSRVSSQRCWNCRPTVHIILRRCAVPAHVFWPTCLQDCPLA